MDAEASQGGSNTRLAVLLAMAMFVLVVDTSLMNVSIAAVVLGLSAYAIGALAMTLAQGLAAIIVFWAIIGGLGASLLLPAMQSLIRGNFEGPAQKKAYALVGASAAIAAAVGPLLGGFVTTLLSWRGGFPPPVGLVVGGPCYNTPG